MSAIAPTAAVAHYREAFERLHSALGGSASRRAVAMERFAELGFPGAREEAWKYTSLRRLESRRFMPATPATAPADVPAAFVAQRLVLANGSAVGPVPATLGGAINWLIGFRTKEKPGSAARANKPAPRARQRDAKRRRERGRDAR